MDNVVTPEIRNMIVGVFLFLLATTLIIRLLKSKLGNTYTELMARMRSWWIMISILAGALYISKAATFIFFGLTSFLALKEYLTIIPTRKVDRRLLWFAYLAIPLQYFFALIGWYGMFSIFIPVYMFILLPIRIVMTGETKGFLTSVSTIQWGLMVTVYAVSHAPYLLSLPESQLSKAGPAGLLIFLVVVTEANDVMQYIAGKLFGKKKLAPTISPKKTWAGLFGGLITSLIVGYLLASYLTPFGSIEALVLAGLGSLFGLAGDLTVSALKRDLEVKDTGSMLPGHGGVMDRIDSLLYNAPLLLHYTRYFYGP